MGLWDTFIDQYIYRYNYVYHPRIWQWQDSNPQPWHLSHRHYVSRLLLPLDHEGSIYNICCHTQVEFWLTICDIQRQQWVQSSLLPIACVLLETLEISRHDCQNCRLVQLYTIHVPQLFPCHPYARMNITKRSILGIDVSTNQRAQGHRCKWDLCLGSVQHNLKVKNNYYVTIY